MRLFLLQRPGELRRGAGRAAGGRLPRRRLAGCRTATRCAPAVDVRPYGGPEGQDWFIVSDLGCAVGGAGGSGAPRGTGDGARRRRRVDDPGRDHRAHAGRPRRSTSVPAPASRRCTPRSTPPVSRPPTSTPAPCASPRLTLALSGAPAAELREGSLFEPVGDETYDLIVSNPPFVISPGARLTYRDGGMGGDDLCRTLVQQAGGVSQRRRVRAASSPTGSTWRARTGSDRLRSWVPTRLRRVDRAARGAGRDAVRRAVAAGRAATTAADPDAYAARYDAWLDEFEARKTKAVGFGWITLRKSDVGRALDHRRGMAASGRAAARGDGRGRTSTARTICGRTTTRRCWPATSCSPARWSRSRSGCPGRRTPSMWCCVRTAVCGGPPRSTRSARASPGCVTARCRAGRILDAIAQLVGEDPVLLRDRTPEAIRMLVEQGFLEPVAAGGLTRTSGGRAERSPGVRRDAVPGCHAARMESGPEAFAGVGVRAVRRRHCWCGRASAHGSARRSPTASAVRWPP